ncbi:MAG: prepilin-type N-terminal cleavage/methylation domain-containing protein, partial [Candidatus Pacebacteria bacterium]|nr:prepilin-type N-terminal cleavage/methylation domain-containing protein [Candidatus Paceibacterota bacterium]
MKKKHFGFTLIELLIVIVILGILSVIGLGAFTSAQMK